MRHSGLKGFPWSLLPLLECSVYQMNACARKSHNIALFQTLSLKLHHNANMLSYSYGCVRNLKYGFINRHFRKVSPSELQHVPVCPSLEEQKLLDQDRFLKPQIQIFLGKPHFQMTLIIVKAFQNKIPTHLKLKSNTVPFGRRVIISEKG